MGHSEVKCSFYVMIYFFLADSQVPVSSDSLSSGYLSNHLSPSHRHRDAYLSPRQLPSRERELLSRDEEEPEVPHYLRSPACRSLSSSYYEPERFRAKRRIDVDDEYVSTPKRLKYGKYFLFPHFLWPESFSDPSSYRISILRYNTESLFIGNVFF
jgi:hypothetical protein